MIHDMPIPIGTRVRLRRVHDFLTLGANKATVLGPGDTRGLVLIRLDRPALCHFEEEDQHEVIEVAEVADNLDVITE